jgi:hypothetical protein
MNFLLLHYQIVHKSYGSLLNIDARSNNTCQLTYSTEKKISSKAEKIKKIFMVEVKACIIYKPNPPSILNVSS